MHKEVRMFFITLNSTDDHINYIKHPAFFTKAEKAKEGIIYLTDDYHEAIPYKTFPKEYKVANFRQKGIKEYNFDVVKLDLRNKKNPKMTVEDSYYANFDNDILAIVQRNDDVYEGTFSGHTLSEAIINAVRYSLADPYSWSNYVPDEDAALDNLEIKGSFYDWPESKKLAKVIEGLENLAPSDDYSETEITFCFVMHKHTGKILYSNMLTLGRYGG